MTPAKWFGNSGSHEKNENDVFSLYIMFEAYIHLRLLHISILDIHKVFEPLVYCLNDTWVHPYTIPPTKLAPDLGSQCQVWSEKNAIMSWFRLKSTSDNFKHPYWTYPKCVSHGHDVSRAFGCTLTPSRQSNWPQIWEVRSTCEEKWCHSIMIEASIHLWLLHTFIWDIYKVFEPLICCLKGIWVHPYTIPTAKLVPDLWSQVYLWSENDVITSFLRLISTSDHFKHPY